MTRHPTVGSPAENPPPATLVLGAPHWLAPPPAAVPLRAACGSLPQEFALLRFLGRDDGVAAKIWGASRPKNTVRDGTRKRIPTPNTKSAADVFSLISVKHESSTHGRMLLPTMLAATAFQPFRIDTDESSESSSFVTPNRTPDGATTPITDAYVPAGSMELTVEEVESYQVGDCVQVTKTVNPARVETLGRTFPAGPRPGLRLKPWTPEAYQILHVRQIREIDGDRLRLDVPLPQSFAAEFDGGTVTKIDLSGEESHMGVERLITGSNRPVKPGRAEAVLGPNTPTH